MGGFRDRTNSYLAGSLRLERGALFLRTSDGIESDLLLDWGGQRWAIEIKLTSDPTQAMLWGLQKAAELVAASDQTLICKTVEEIRSDSLLLTNLPSFLNELAEAKN